MRLKLCIAPTRKVFCKSWVKLLKRVDGAQQAPSGKEDVCFENAVEECLGIIDRDIAGFAIGAFRGEEKVCFSGEWGFRVLEEGESGYFLAAVVKRKAVMGFWRGRE